MTASHRVRACIAAAGGIVLVIPVGFLTASPIVPAPLRITLGILWLSAIAAPRVACVLLLLLAPCGAVVLSALDAPPVQYTEAMVLATLSGALIAYPWGRAVPGPSPGPRLTPATIAFVAVVLASLAVGLAVSQTGAGLRWTFVRGLGLLLARDYLASPPGQWSDLTAAARLVEGVLLLFVAARAASGSPRRSVSLMRALAAGAAVAATLAITQMIGIAWANGSVRAFATALLTGRFSVHVADTNAAGSFYTMAGFVAVGLVLASGERRQLRALWAACAALTFLAMWLSGSRAAVVAVAAILAAGLVLRIRKWGRVSFSGSPFPTRSVIAVMVIAATLAAVALAFDPRAVARRGVLNALNERAAFAVTGLQMIATAPIFGTGIGRYFETSGRFMPQSIYWFHFHENAHNNFLQVGGELGLLGLGTFVWLLAAAARHIKRALDVDADNRITGGAAAGLSAFVVTWLAGHPLLTPEVAVPFWVILGATVARADLATFDQKRTEDPKKGYGPFSPVSLGLTIAILALLATIPFRARSAIASLKLPEQTFGFYDWEGDRATGRFRWTTADAAFFISPQASELDVPFCAAWADHRSAPTVVTFAIDGRIFHRLETRSGDWTSLRLRLPPPSDPRRYRRIDITTEPSWSPAAVLGTRDSRALGVEIGEVAAR